MTDYQKVCKLTEFLKERLKKAEGSSSLKDQEEIGMIIDEIIFYSDRVIFDMK